MRTFKIPMEVCRTINGDTYRISLDRPIQEETLTAAMFRAKSLVWQDLVNEGELSGYRTCYGVKGYLEKHGFQHVLFSRTDKKFGLQVDEFALEALYKEAVRPKHTTAHITWWSKDRSDPNRPTIRYTDLSVRFDESVASIIDRLRQENPDLDFLSNVSVSVPFNYTQNPKGETTCTNP